MWALFASRLEACCRRDVGNSKKTTEIFASPGRDDDDDDDELNYEITKYLKTRSIAHTTLALDWKPNFSSSVELCIVAWDLARFLQFKSLSQRLD